MLAVEYSGQLPSFGRVVLVVAQTVLTTFEKQRLQRYLYNVLINLHASMMTMACHAQVDTLTPSISTGSSVGIVSNLLLARRSRLSSRVSPSFLSIRGLLHNTILPSS